MSCHLVRISHAVVLVTIPLVGLLAPAVAGEPTVVKPGDSAVDGSFIKPFTNSWQMRKTLKSGEVQELGRWTDEVTIEKSDAGPIIVRRQRIPGPTGYRILVNHVRQKDLVPILREFSVEDGGQVLQKVEFDGTNAKLAQAGLPEPAELTFEQDVFDWYLYGLLLIGFPLQQDYTARFPSLGGGSTLEWREFNVVAQESVAALSGKSYDCWKVEVDDGLTFWVTRKSPYIITLANTAVDGSTTRWEME